MSWAGWNARAVWSIRCWLPLTPVFLDVASVRSQFPILAEPVNGHPLIWFDNGATTQKPQRVIDRISEFYRHENSNIHRGAHELAARATDATKMRERLYAGSSAPGVWRRSSSPGEPPRASIWWLNPGVPRICVRETKSSSPTWSTIRPPSTLVVTTHGDNP